MLTISNAMKSAIITLVNATMGLILVFGVALSDAQQGAILLFANALLGLGVLLTFKSSSKRIPDPPAPPDA